MNKKRLRVMPWPTPAQRTPEQAASVTDTMPVGDQESVVAGDVARPAAAVTPATVAQRLGLVAARRSAEIPEAPDHSTAA